MDAYTGTRAPSHPLDTAALSAWLGAHVAGFQGPLSVAQFKTEFNEYSSAPEQSFGPATPGTFAPSTASTTAMIDLLTNHLRRR
jgi:hypothetical protein